MFCSKMSLLIGVLSKLEQVQLSVKQGYEFLQFFGKLAILTPLERTKLLKSEVMCMNKLSSPL